MSYPAAAHHHPGDRYAHREAARVQPRTAAPQQRIAAGDYTLVHRGKLVRAGPVAFWTLVGTLVIMAGWTMVTVTYFAFQDDVLTRLIARQAEMQYAYEDRIADMRTQVDRVTSRQMLDQEQVEQKLDQISKRQAMLESRANALGNLAGDPGVTGSVKPNGRDQRKPSPIGDGASLEPRGFSAIVARFTGRAPAGGMNGSLARLQDSIERVETKQSNSLANIEESYSSKARRIRSVLAEVGVGPGKAPADAVGGPYVPVKMPIDNNAFEKQLRRISTAKSYVEQLNKTVTAVPLRQPLPGELDQSSGFGVRADPFLRRPAMHTGLDFRGDVGDPVRATASGTVATAGWNGGYGKMVEIEHANGLATRYGHLSSIEVREGQTIRPGQIIGRIGSTGRSTGPHLHYETRVEGDAVDPTRFLRAGAKLGLMQ
ncbi:MAG: peptidoglycan DD-metalloendopeptidase family protein [Alphaproteobacteria bacterium]|nr:peptidoglycan DD-metalloendopeptidase family protein [Alphaproteobacteria bacterium]